MKLKKITLRGYKSILTLENFELRNLNVLIGANGAGKSNLISVFRLLAALADGNLQEYVQKRGGPDALLHGGRKRTSKMDLEFYFGVNGYLVTLVPTVDNRLIFRREQTWFNGDYRTYTENLGSSHDEAKLRNSYTNVSNYVRPALKTWRVYHFHDTSDDAKVKQPHAKNDNLLLKQDASNLAACIADIYKKFPRYYTRIVDTIRLAAPFFGDFVIRDPLPDIVELEWTEQGDPDTPRRAHLLSDGTLRFICLTTLLLQPRHKVGDMVIIDEPELGLHPYAINLLAEMIREVAETHQVFVSTQSVELLNAFVPEDVVIVELHNGASTFSRLNQEGLDEWLQEYTLGELWKRNILGGRPTR